MLNVKEGYNEWAETYDSVENKSVVLDRKLHNSCCHIFHFLVPDLPLEWNKR